MVQQTATVSVLTFINSNFPLSSLKQKDKQQLTNHIMNKEKDKQQLTNHIMNKQQLTNHIMNKQKDKQQLTNLIMNKQQLTNHIMNKQKDKQQLTNHIMNKQRQIFWSSRSVTHETFLQICYCFLGDEGDGGTGFLNLVLLQRTLSVLRVTNRKLRDFPLFHVSPSYQNCPSQLGAPLREVSVCSDSDSPEGKLSHFVRSDVMFSLTFRHRASSI